ncbi:MAG: GNAT family N-acetyltransferase [Chloroflexota bacterium]|nr:GNAT family N-acetyltransferase [Chloroflexota bacterium]
MTPAGVTIRAAGLDDLPACAGIWREALNDFFGRLNLPAVPPEVASLTRLHAHVLSSDPARFMVAARADPATGGERLVGFVAATRRDLVWFLSMLFIRPGDQGAGLGRALLERVMPADDAVTATATDTAQPISNALYSSCGMVPRIPLLNLVGRPARPGAFDRLPSGVAAQPMVDGDAATVDTLDAAVAGFRHPQDHAFLRAESRRGFLYRAPDGTAVGYGYASEAGRVGPIAVRDEALLAPVLGHLLTAVEPRGASALWVSGAAGGALMALLRAGLRLEGFPVLLCWNRPFADFSRYVPISPGLL